MLVLIIQKCNKSISIDELLCYFIVPLDPWTRNPSVLPHEILLDNLEWLHQSFLPLPSLLSTALSLYQLLAIPTDVSPSSGSLQKFMHLYIRVIELLAPSYTSLDPQNAALYGLINRFINYLTVYRS